MRKLILPAAVMVLAVIFTVHATTWEHCTTVYPGYPEDTNISDGCDTGGDVRSVITPHVEEEFYDYWASVMVYSDGDSLAYYHSVQNLDEGYASIQQETVQENLSNNQVRFSLFTNGSSTTTRADFYILVTNN